jgi:type III pantothenate kinase
MLLAIEIGNTSVAAATFDGARLVALWRGGTHAASEPFADWLPTDIDAVALAGVVPDVVARWERAVGARLDLEALVVGRDCAPPMPTHYAPGQLGIDRLLAATAAAEQFGKPVLVADCGTCTTLDAVSPDGTFMGGAILCGLETARDALAERAALLPSVPLEAPCEAIGRSTVACLQAGLVLGHCGAIAWLARRMRHELAAPWAPLIGTGGLADRIEAASPGLFAHLEPHLVLHGLRLTWEAVQGEAPPCEA